MRRIVLYMACSIDGCIARNDGSVDWLDTEADIGETYAFSSFLERIDTIVMGRKSYDQMLTFGEWPHSKCQTHVFTRSTFEPKTSNTHIVVDPDPEFVRDLKGQEGKDIWLFGGGALNSFFAKHELIDEIMLFVQPTVLGAGIRLFGDHPLEPKQFSRKQACELGGGFTLLWYER